MHYKNGREAKEFDPVIYQDEYTKEVKVGKIFQLNSGSETCNCNVTVIIPGGVQQECKTVGELYHAENSFQAIESQGQSKEA